MRTIVIGDVHGCVLELERLLHALNWSKKDRVILDGDLVDRGPWSADVVSLAMLCNFEVVLGNHEEKHIRYRKHLEKQKKDQTYKIPVKMYGKKLEVNRSLTDSHIDFLSNSVPFIRLNDKFIVVHGGLQDDCPEKQDPNTICRLRYMDKDTKKPKSLIKDFQAPPNSVFWTDLWQGPECVIYGHTVHWLEPKPYLTVRSGDLLAMGIDTGACFGGHLTAFVLEDDGRWWYKSVKSDVSVNLEKWGK